MAQSCRAAVPRTALLPVGAAVLAEPSREGCAMISADAKSQRAELLCGASRELEVLSR